MDKKAIEQELKVAAGDLLDTVKKLVREGNVRRIIVRNAEGRTLVDMPLTAGVSGALLLPFFTMLTGIVALFKDFTVVRERHDRGVTKPQWGCSRDVFQPAWQEPLDYCCLGCPLC